MKPTGRALNGDLVELPAAVSGEQYLPQASKCCVLGFHQQSPTVLATACLAKAPLRDTLPSPCCLLDGFLTCLLAFLLRSSALFLCTPRGPQDGFEACSLACLLTEMKDRHRARARLGLEL